MSTFVSIITAIFCIQICAKTLLKKTNYKNKNKRKQTKTKRKKRTKNKEKKTKERKKRGERNQ